MREDSPEGVTEYLDTHRAKVTYQEKPRSSQQNAGQNSIRRQKGERVKGIEPSYAAWEAAVLPLNYTRGGRRDLFDRIAIERAKYRNCSGAL